MQQSEAVPVASKVFVHEIAQLLGRTLVIVAHPDDEVIGCGALLQRMSEPVVVFCTDGAPRPAQWWQNYGSREAYSRLRRTEAREALGCAGVRSVEFLADDRSEMFVDQELFRRLPEAITALDRLINRYQPDALLTHAYEGGHPDHDACCFVTSVVARQNSLPAWEMPLYHRDPQGNGVRQQFIQNNSHEIELDVTASEQERKARMLRAYASQGDIISAFDPAKERVRRLHAYDFTQPPHRGKLNYELWGWSMNGEEVSQAFAAYMNGTFMKGATTT
ncbi:MAG: PIG-L family deacetylase [Acidobacteriales bacterium]|nr:PIG-L family deacetylase [Terriglobales bacterium]